MPEDLFLTIVWYFYDLNINNLNPGNPLCLSPWSHKGWCRLPANESLWLVIQSRFITQLQPLKWSQVIANFFMLSLCFGIAWQGLQEANIGPNIGTDWDEDGSSLLCSQKNSVPQTSNSITGKCLTLILGNEIFKRLMGELYSSKRFLVQSSQCSLSNQQQPTSSICEGNSQISIRLPYGSEGDHQIPYS